MRCRSCGVDHVVRTLKYRDVYREIETSLSHRDRDISLIERQRHPSHREIEKSLS